MIFVQVGFGFFVEFTLDEALRFIGKKEKQLNERSDKLSSEVIKIKAHIKLVLEVSVPFTLSFRKHRNEGIFSQSVLNVLLNVSVSYAGSARIAKFRLPASRKGAQGRVVVTYLICQDQSNVLQTLFN